MHPIRQLFSAVLFALALSITATRGAVVPGHVETWGNNVFERATPPPGLDGVIAVAAGSEHSLALRTNGTVVAWGNNSHGQCNVPADLNDVMAIAAGLHSVALRSNGTVVVWGSTNALVTTIPAGLTNVVAISARGSVGSLESYTLALRQDGTVAAWGEALTGQTNVPVGLTGVAKISAGYGHALSLKTDGTIVGWGQNFLGIASHPPGLTSVVDIEAGQGCSYAVLTDGSTFYWGDPFHAVNAQRPVGLASVKSLQLGYTFAVALRNDGSVASWGIISDGTGLVNAQIPNGINGVSAISVNDNHALYLSARPLVSGITPPVKATIGSPLALSVQASGVDLQYQWKKNGVDLAGRNEATLTITSVQPSDAGSYMVRVSNPHGYYDSPTTSISFDPPVIQSGPGNIQVYRGENAIFSVTAQAAPGLDPLSYEWRKGLQVIPDALSSNLVVANVRSSNTGFYRVIVKDIAGGTVSATGQLVVIDPTVVTTNATILRKALVSVGANPQGTNTILAGTRRNGVVDRAIIAFDFSAVPPGAIINFASLRMNVAKLPRSAKNSTFSLYSMIKPWGPGISWTLAETGVPWGAPGAQAGTDYTATSSAEAPIAGFANYDFASPQLAADIQSWLNDPASNHGWFFKSESESLGSTARHFGPAPQLTVSYVLPAPSPDIQNVRLEGANLVFEMNGSAGRVYRVDSRADFEQGNWTVLTNAPAGAGTNRIVIWAPIVEPTQFYRVAVE